MVGRAASGVDPSIAPATSRTGQFSAAEGTHIVTAVGDPSRFAREQRRLLQLERHAELDATRQLWVELPEEELARRGITLLGMTILERGIALGGRTSLVLERANRRPLGAHRFTPGDVVALRAAAEHGGMVGHGEFPGVVTRCEERRITVVLDRGDTEGEELPDPVRVDRVAPDVTFRRMDDALREIQLGLPGPSGSLRAVAFGARAPVFAIAPETAGIRFLDERLDASQREAVAHALRADDIALIHGPPGTGKTTAVVELIRQAVRRGTRVLATAPSNVAVDNLVERLAGPDLKLVRVGHPARASDVARPLTLDAQVERGPDAPRILMLRKELAKALGALAKTAERDRRRRALRQVAGLRKQLRDAEDRAIKAILDAADVVCTTAIGAATMALRDRDFGLVVVDEAAQCLEAAAWVPLLRGRRAVLAGDHLQLPPTIRSRRAADDGLAVTLFERLDTRYGRVATRMLTVQYRMHERIMAWASAASYGGRLTADPSVAAHRLCDLPHVASNDRTTSPCVLLDTAGLGFGELASPENRSKRNPGEARLVAHYVEDLLRAGVRPGEIGVITPYNAQATLLRDALRRRDRRGAGELEIGTVDGFQGREKEVVVVSCVRSNPSGEIGFLAESRRMNVAITRARRQIVVVGDSATLGRDPFLAGLIAHLRRVGSCPDPLAFA